MKQKIKKRQLPLMGWSSWNCFFTQISEENLLPQVDALVDTGLARAGYEYFNIDDCFQNGRGENGLVMSKPHTFPNGMRYLADYIHSKGLKAGIYTDGGEDTCSSNYSKENFVGKGTGLYGHEQEDLRQLLIDWDYDYVKVDWCGGKKLGLDRETQYTKIGNIIEKLREEKGRDIIYNVCCWEFPGQWVTKIADSWRTAEDISYANNRASFSSVLLQLDTASAYADYQSPGHVNDPDMLIVGLGMTPEEDKSHFTMWCMLSAPLVLGNNLTQMPPETLELIKNEQLIAIDQDPLVKQATLVMEKDKVQTWIKPLANGDKAVAILNRNNCEATVTFSFEDFGFSGQIMAHDIWAKKDVGTCDSITAYLAPHDCVLYRVVGQCEKLEKFDAQNTSVRCYDVQLTGKTKAQTVMEKGGVIIDIRNPESFEQKHVENAVNIPFENVVEQVENVIRDKSTTIVVYGSCRSRSIQTAKLLMTLGYTNVFDIGIMENWYV